MTDSVLEAEMQHDGQPVHRGIKWLVALHLIVGIAPLASGWLADAVWVMPVYWALSALCIAQLTLLSLWVVLSERRWPARLAGAVSGTAYVTLWLVLGICISSVSTDHVLLTISGFLEVFGYMFASYAALVAVISTAFLLMRRFGARLTNDARTIASLTPRRSQYSVFHLLVITSVCSLILCLVKVSQPSEHLERTGMLAVVAGYLLAIVIFLINSVCAVWATLSPRSPCSRIGIALLVSSLLGVSLATDSGNDAGPWWMVLAASSIPVIVTAIVVLSLLVVRACGYRMVSNTANPA